MLLAPSGERLTASGKKWIIRLRIFSLLLLLFLLLRPTVVYTETLELPASLFLLLDQSESMSVRDEVGGKSRFELAQETLRDSEKILQRLQKRFDLHPLLFDAAPHPLPMSRGVVQLPEKPEGSETALGFVLEETYQQAAGKRLLGVLLLTDGNQKARPPRDATPRDAAVPFRDGSDPIYTVGFGKPGASENLDVAVRELTAPDHMFVKNELVVSGQIRINGYLNQPVPIRLLLETAPGIVTEVDRKTILAKTEGQLVSYRFSCIPETTGLKKITVDVPPLPKEVVQTNNTMSTFVRVLDGGLNVLYLEGTPRSEQIYLRRAIDSSADIRLSYHRFPVVRTVIAGNPGAGTTPEQALARETAQRPSYKNEYFGPGKFNVYIIGDLDAAAFKTEELEALADAVRNGAGLIMLGGYHTFGAGGYAGTPLQDVLPVVLSPFDRQKWGEHPREDIHWTVPLLMQPTAQSGKGTHSIMQLAGTPAENTKLWRSLPPLEGANRLQPKQAALVLAEGPQRQPLLIQQNFGSGRVLAFAGDTTWRWWAEHETEHKRFWRQVILWLAKMDDSMQGDCWIELEKTRYYPGETVKFKVRMRNDKGEEIRSPKVEARVRFPDGREESIATVEENGIATGSLRNAQLPGDYEIRATATSGGDDSIMRQAGSRFLVFEQNLEMDNPVADPALLGSLAKMTGGRYLTPESFPKLLEELETKAELLTEKRETKRTLYDTWPVLLLLLGVFCVEWYLRKRGGLV